MFGISDPVGQIVRAVLYSLGGSTGPFSGLVALAAWLVTSPSVLVVVDVYDAAIVRTVEPVVGPVRNIVATIRTEIQKAGATAAAGAKTAADIAKFAAVGYAFGNLAMLIGAAVVGVIFVKNWLD